MSEPTVLELILQKIDSLDEKVTEGFRRVNGRLDKHDDSIGHVQQFGCARFEAHQSVAPPGPSKMRQAAETGGIATVAVALFELAKVALGVLGK
jgi:hypothetical protein